MNESKKIDGTGQVLLKGNSTLKVDESVSISELIKRIKDLEKAVKELVNNISKY